MTETKTNRYNNSKVYKLVDEQQYYYYGSTCLPLHKRAYFHRMKSKECPERKIYNVFTHERFLNGEIKIVLVEQFNLNSKEELFKEENKYIERSLNDEKCLNSHLSIYNYEAQKAKNKEYRKAHLIEGKQRYLKYYYENKERIKEKSREYRKDHREECKEKHRKYHSTHKEQHSEYSKKYVEEHKTETQAYMKAYNEAHKEEIKARRGEKIICECGQESTKQHLKRHQQTKKHLELMQQKQT